jgi:hypothetical protein
MERVEELAIIRRAYAKQILAAVEIDDPSLELAFAQVRREDFLGPGPGVIPRWFGGYLPTPSADPVYLYIDNVVQIIAVRHLNKVSRQAMPSGSPALQSSRANTWCMLVPPLTTPPSCRI